ncbi:MAG: (Na+)-NQR maturation NqrM [Porticoccaceae bacterium]|jgi:uncharacterized protein|nr:(Na+)-NQR maturation NqrM [Porticoccaceae bacterium]
MQTFLIALFAFLLVMTIMAVGVIMGRKPITGSCGGVGAALGEVDYECELCGGDEAKCESIQAENTNAQAANRAKGSFYSADG